MDRRTRRAALATTVINEFTAAVLDTRAIDAVVRLRQSLDADGATAETVRTVHEFVREPRGRSKLRAS